MIGEIKQGEKTFFVNGGELGFEFGEPCEGRPPSQGIFVWKDLRNCQIAISLAGYPMNVCSH